GGVARFADGRIQESYTVSSGLGTGAVRHLRLDQDGTIWAATEGGLSRLKNGRVATLNSRNGLPCDIVFWVGADDEGSLWIGTACGLVRVARAEIDGWSAAVDADKNTQRKVSTRLFDSGDGVRIARGFYYNSPVVRSSDGKLWFMSQGGVSVLDPRHLPFNNL